MSLTRCGIVTLLTGICSRLTFHSSGTYGGNGNKGGNFLSSHFVMDLEGASATLERRSLVGVGVGGGDGGPAMI